MTPNHRPDMKTEPQPTIPLTNEGATMNHSNNTPSDMRFLQIHTLSCAPDTDYSVSGLIELDKSSWVTMLHNWHLWRFILTKETVTFQRVTSLNPEVVAPEPGLEFPNTDNKRSGLLDRGAFLTTPGSRTEWLIADFYRLVGSELHFYKGSQKTYVLDINKVSTWAAMPTTVNQKENTVKQETPEEFQNRIDKSMTDTTSLPPEYQTLRNFARGMVQNPLGAPYQQPWDAHPVWQPQAPVTNPWQAQPNNGLPGYPTPPAGSAFELRLGINGYGYYPREPIMNHPQPSYRNPMQTPPNNCFPGYPMPPAGPVFPNQPYPPMPVPGPGVWAQQPMKTCTEILIIFNGEGTYSATGPWELGSGKRTVGVVVAPQTAHTHVRFAVNTGCKQYTPPVIDYVIPLPIEQIKVCIVSLRDDVVKTYVHGVEFQEDIEVGKVYFTEKERLRVRIEELEKELESFKKPA